MSQSSTPQLNSLHTFTDEEDMLRESGTLMIRLQIKTTWLRHNCGTDCFRL